MYRSTPHSISGEDDVPVTQRIEKRLLRMAGQGLRVNARRRTESSRARYDAIMAESDGVYGSPKIRDELREEGYRCGRHKVARLMRKAGLKGCPKRRFKVTTQP